MHEAKMHDESVFVTLTYDEENLPKGGTLVVDDCQKFLKRLRERIRPSRIRFFLCGEYGEKRGRPHYHALIFGFGFPDKVPLEKSGEFVEYSSRLLSESWGHGDARLGSVSFDSACYVANYATKKITGEKAAEHYRGRKPEFLLMSRGGRKAGGIGREWIKKFSSDVYPADEVIVNGCPAKPPRYYDQVVQACDPALVEGVRLKREVAAEETEEYIRKVGGRPVKFKISPSNNMWRLKVRETVAKAKASLKSRNLELHT